MLAGVPQSKLSCGNCCVRVNSANKAIEKRNTTCFSSLEWQLIFIKGEHLFIYIAVSYQELYC